MNAGESRLTSFSAADMMQMKKGSSVPQAVEEGQRGLGAKNLDEPPSIISFSNGSLPSSLSSSMDAVLSTTTPLLECLYASGGLIGPLSPTDQEVYEVDRCKALAARARSVCLVECPSLSISPALGNGLCTKAQRLSNADEARETWDGQRRLRCLSFAYVLEQLRASEVPLDWLETVAWEESLAFFVDCYLKEKNQLEETLKHAIARRSERGKRQASAPGRASCSGGLMSPPEGLAAADGEVPSGDTEGEGDNAGGRDPGGSLKERSSRRGTTLLRPPPVLSLMSRFARRFWFLREQSKASPAQSPDFPSFCAVPETDRGSLRPLSSVHSLPPWQFFFFEELASFLLFVLQQMQRLQQRGGVYVHLASATWTRRYQHLHFCLEKVDPPPSLRQRAIEEARADQQLLSLSSSSSCPAASSFSASSAVAASPPAPCSSPPLSLPPLHHLMPSLCQYFPETAETAPHSFWLVYDAKLCRWLVTRDSLPVREVYVHSNSAPSVDGGSQARRRRPPSMTAIETARQEALFYLSLCGVRGDEEDDEGFTRNRKQRSASSPLDHTVLDRLMYLLERRESPAECAVEPAHILKGEEDAKARESSSSREPESKRNSGRPRESEGVALPRRTEKKSPSVEARRSRFSSAPLRDSSSRSRLKKRASRASEAGRGGDLPCQHPAGGRRSLGEPEAVTEEGNEAEEREMLAVSSCLRKRYRRRPSADSTSSLASVTSQTVQPKRPRLRNAETPPESDASADDGDRALEPNAVVEPRERARAMRLHGLSPAKRGGGGGSCVSSVRRSEGRRKQHKDADGLLSRDPAGPATPPGAAEKENARQSVNVSLEESGAGRAPREGLFAAPNAECAARDAAWMEGIHRWHHERGRAASDSEEAARAEDREAPRKAFRAKAPSRGSSVEQSLLGRHAEDSRTDVFASSEDDEEAVELERGDGDVEREARRRTRVSAPSPERRAPSPFSAASQEDSDSESCGHPRSEGPRRASSSSHLKKKRRERRASASEPSTASRDLPGMASVDVSRKENLSGGRFLVGSRFRNTFFSDELLAFAHLHAAFLGEEGTKRREGYSAKHTARGEGEGAPARAGKKIFTEKEILRLLRNYMRQTCSKKGKKHFICDNALKELTGTQTLPVDSDKLLHALKSAKLLTHFMIA
ncbi:hypothetical protein BESB_070380 [Besnoitia besnoiti]|uniref:Uncharacterized protein n=1 Tax=Besnoitia besnoiti TaxID=94643 RepID=A0A2A9MD57_BESBE|nr:uncharacterized protein BESB_070380 [Besnoitia besnoiti]PFH33886.1 hypothetical protein BESB_070380 [Besnoitia besnoiti]